MPLHAAVAIRRAIPEGGVVQHALCDFVRSCDKLVDESIGAFSS